MEEVQKLYGLNPNVQPIGEGVEAVIYPLDTERVVRIYRDKDISRQSRLESMQEFYDSLDTSKVNFGIPKILSIDTGNGVVSTVDKRLHGQDFGQEYERLTSSERHQVLLGYLEAAEQIHYLASPYPYFGEVLAEDPIRESSWHDFLAKKIGLAYVQGEKKLGKDVPRMQDILAYMMDQLSLFDTVNEARLVHGDFYVSNVLVADGGVSAVIDFNDLTLAGDYRMDIASAIIFLGDQGTGTRDNDREILVDAAVARHGESIKDVIHFYELYYALIFGSYAKETDPKTYKWAVDVLSRQANTAAK